MAATGQSVCFDIQHHESEDLLNPLLQRKLLGMVSRGFFFAMAASPVCASFSVAVTPPCRSKEFPLGVPWTSERQKEKNKQGNSQLAFVLKAVKLCIQMKILFWVENPHGSWFGDKKANCLGMTSWREEKLETFL